MFPLSRKVKSDALVVLLRRLRTWPTFIINREHRHSTNASIEQPLYRGTDQWCLRRPPSVRAAAPAGKPHRCNETEPGSEWLTHSPSATEKTCSTNTLPSEKLWQRWATAGNKCCTFLSIIQKARLPILISKIRLRASKVHNTHCLKGTEQIYTHSWLSFISVVSYAIVYAARSWEKRIKK